MVVSSLIKDINQIGNSLNSIDFILHEYVNFKKDDAKFKTHIEKVIDERRKKSAKDGTSNDLSNNK